MCAAFVHESHELGPAHIARFNTIKLKTGSFNERADGAVKMTAAANPLPDRSEPILPAHHLWVWRLAVLGKQQMPTGLEYPAHFLKCPCDIGYAAQSPSGHDSID